MPVRFLSNNKKDIFVESRFAWFPEAETLRATITRYDLPHFYIRSPEGREGGEEQGRDTHSARRPLAFPNPFARGTLPLVERCVSVGRGGGGRRRAPREKFIESRSKVFATAAGADARVPSATTIRNRG